jgi:hypothetical protein
MGRTATCWEPVVADRANTHQELVQAAHTQLAVARARTGN